MYKSELGGLKTDYAVMNMELLVQTINRLPYDEAVTAVTQLQAMAVEQVKWKSTPQNGLASILMFTGPGPRPIEEVRNNIQNTVRFTEEVLKVLQGK